MYEVLRVPRNVQALWQKNFDNHLNDYQQKNKIILKKMNDANMIPT